MTNLISYLRFGGDRLNTQALKAEIVRNGMTQAEVAKAIGISPTTFWRKMKRRNFGLNEANALITLLHIENPADIFFGNK